jgi:hypothetical protein
MVPANARSWVAWLVGSPVVDTQQLAGGMTTDLTALPHPGAQWAGHSVDVLLRIYAKCVVGQDELAKRHISEALREG